MRRILLVAMLLCFFAASAWGEAKIYADRELENDVVIYEIATLSNEILWLAIKYDGRESEASIADAQLWPKEQPEGDGEFEKFIASKNGQAAKITFAYKNGEKQWARIETKYSPEHVSEDNMTTLVIVSRQGYEVIFDFHWRGTEIHYVRVYPRIHPYKDLIDQNY